MSFKKRYKVAYIALAMFAAVSLTACGSSTRQKDQAAYRQYGINCLTEGKYEDAVGAFQLALGQSRGKIGETELDICYYKAEAQYLAGYREDAEETYTAVIHYNEDPEAYYLRGNLYFQMGRTEEGLADLAAAAAGDAKNYELYIGIYETLAANDMEAEGQEYLNKALSIRGEKAYDKMEKGRIYLLLGDTENALSYLREALDKGEETANFYMAEAYEAAGDLAQADTYFQAYLDCGIADSSELCQMGESQMAQGDATRALEYFAAALELDSVPNKQNILKDMVIAYESLGNFSSAKSTMKDYLKLYADDEAAQREMTFLETR